MFENSYLDPEVTKQVVGNPDFMKEGYDAQVRSVVMIKNQNNTLPLEKNLKVYVPKRYTPAGRDWFGRETPERWSDPVSISVIVLVNVSNPIVFSEIERNANSILVHFGFQDQALMDIITGEKEPSGLLPFQMLADMKTVEVQYEDVPRYMNCYVDSDGNKYDFGFGLNWKGVINDDRVAKYR